MAKRQVSLRYDHRDIEVKWAKVWRDSKLDTPDLIKAGRPFYNLMMFPYPSAEGLHVGNMYAFTGTDIYGRFKRMQGYDVFEPIGLDGFGIHSENYAFKVGRHPAKQAKVSQENFYRQLGVIGCMFDWTRTLETYDPDYYKWTQWLFVQMFKYGLAYRSESEVNWCSSCKTVLADEQVIAEQCERCGNKVEKKALQQWFFRITAYAEKLLENIKKLKWSEKVLTAQRNWIGKKEGINITYPVVDENGKPFVIPSEVPRSGAESRNPDKNSGSGGDPSSAGRRTRDDMPAAVTCFTTRPDTNFGATFVVVAPENDLVSRITYHVSPEKKKEIEVYIQVAKKKSKEERIAGGRKKTGVFTGLYCINQLNNYKMPLYVSDFVVMEVGTGVVVGVPGHDKRDFEFACAMKLPVIRVVVGLDGDTSPITRIEQVQEEEGTMVNSDFLNGREIQKAIGVMMDHLEKEGWGKRVVTYHLRDWIISRQRYWGPPIPMIYCETCAKEGKSWFTTEEAKTMSFPRKRESSDSGGDDNTMAGWYPIPEDQLPVELPYIKDYKPTGDGVAPLAKHKEFYEVACPECGAKARRETDVSDTFLDSSWYFLRYPSVGAESGAYRGSPFAAPFDKTQGKHPVFTPSEVEGLEKARRAAPALLPWDPEITKKWLPVSMYTGGAEHSVLHLMYSRFVWMCLCDWGYLDFSGKAGPRSAWDEPFPNFFAHGLVIKDGAKMSKSKGNVVNPDEYIKLYGTDALRLYLVFMGPFDQGGDFRDSAMEGMSRWVGRVWRMAMNSLSGSTLQDSARLNLQKALHRLVKKVTEDTEARRYNTAIAAMMEFTNLVTKGSGLKKPQGQTPLKGLTTLDQDSLKIFVLLLAPFAPHLAEELWSRCSVSRIHDSQSESGQQKTWSVHLQPWPAYDPKLLEEDTVEIVIQVNGKLRDTISVERPFEKTQGMQASSVKEEVEKLARQSPKVAKFLEGKTVKKVIFVSGKLVNFVLQNKGGRS